jgi:hypothetical protein
MNFHRLHTVLVLLANAYMEVACPNPEAPEMSRCWVIRRTVDYSRICIQ